MLPAVIVIVILLALALFAIAPGRADDSLTAPFRGRNIAHRGLFQKDQSVPENSLAAFRLAVENGYGIELDVHITKDDRLAVFHDDDLGRMCGVSGRPEDKTYEELSMLRLADTDERIPLLSDVLAVMGGKEPIVLELKRGGRDRKLCELAHAQLSGYSGAVCIESFDPFIVRWWRKNAREYLRGQLSAAFAEMKKGTNAAAAFILSRLLLNFLARPQFIAYGICKRKPLCVRMCERMGAMKVAWTSHDAKSEAVNDAVIFEHYRPEIRFGRQ